MMLSDESQLSQTISRTRDLLYLLENNQIQDAQSLIDSFSPESNNSNNLFGEVGRLTRNLHEALTNFQMDERITDIAATGIPEAEQRLNYVIEKTEAAANKTMDMVESCTLRSNAMAKDSEELLVEWKKLYSRELEAGDFRKLCRRIEMHLIKNKNDADELHKELNEVLLAQDYQDLTGQVIRQVITLVHDVEESMVNIIKMFGSMDGYDKAKNKQVVKQGAEGPVVDKNKRDDIVQGQDEVDDLLSSMGF